MHLPLPSQEKSGNVFTPSQTNMLLIAKLILILCTKYATQGFGFEFPKICLCRVLSHPPSILHSLVQVLTDFEPHGIARRQGEGRIQSQKHRHLEAEYC